MRSHAELIQVLELKYKYGEAIHQFSIPKNQKYLTLNTAKWCIKKLHVFNKNNRHIKYVIRLCNEYITIHNRIVKKRKV